MSKHITVYNKNGHKTTYLLGSNKKANEYECGCLYLNNLLLYCPQHFQHIKDLQNRIVSVRNNILASPLRKQVVKWSCDHVDINYRGKYCGICGRKVKCTKY